MPERFRDRLREFLRRPRLADADRRAETRRLDEHRTAQLGDDSLKSRRVAIDEGEKARDRQSAVAHEPLGDILVHRRRRAKDARADVRNAGDFGCALDRPVLAERPMQDREDDIDHTRQIGRRPFRLGEDREPPATPRHERHARSALWNGGREPARFKRTHEPGAGPGYADRNRIVARRVERAEHVAGGHDGYVVLGRAAAEQQRDAKSLGHVAISKSVHCRGTSKRLGWSTSSGKPKAEESARPP